MNKRVVQSTYVKKPVKETLNKFYEAEGYNNATSWASALLEKAISKYLAKKERRMQKGG
jgi:hypothetical protein